MVKRLLIGDWCRPAVLPVFYRGDGNALLIGPPGSGKGQTIVSNALRLPFLALHDLDGETSAICYQLWRRRGYSVTLLNGADLFGMGTRSINPLDHADAASSKFPDRCTFLARLIVTRTHQERDRFFPDKQESGLAAIIGLVASTGPAELRTLLRVRDLLMQDAAGFGDLCAAMARSPHAFVAAQGREWQRQMTLESRTFDGVLSGMERDTFFLQTDIARRLFARTDCRLEDLMGRDAQGRRLPGAVVSAMMPVAHIADQAASMRLILGCLMLTLSEGEL